jgi:DmsE family decaheme c-type cytochrome
MGRFKRTLGSAVPIAGALVMWLIAMATVPAQGTPAAVSQAAPAAPAQAGDYVGEDTCLTCHDTQSYKGTAHARKANTKTPAATHGCESCHGPGKAHVDGGGDKTQIKTFKAGGLSPQEASEVCATCHNRGEHLLWAGSQHDRRNVSCVTCHNIHDSKSLKAQLKTETQGQLCAQCHRDKVAKLDRSGHMPVREGKIECNTCHNVHGSQNVRLLRAGNSIGESCQSCHQEKRGPFLWEHAPVRENCTTCHDPHGSANERMLVAKQPFLCQRCHNHTRHPSTIYDKTVVESVNRLYGRSCVNCHANIHGSNHPSGMTFLR